MTIPEGQELYRAKRCAKNNKEEDNSPENKCFCTTWQDLKTSFNQNYLVLPGMKSVPHISLRLFESRQYKLELYNK